MRISQSLLRDAELAVRDGGRASASSRATSLVQLVLATALLEGKISSARFDSVASEYMSDTRSAQKAIADSGNEYDEIAKMVQEVIGVTVDGRTGMGTFSALVDYHKNKKYPGPYMEVGSPQTIPTSDDIMGSSSGNNRYQSQAKYGSAGRDQANTTRDAVGRMSPEARAKYYASLSSGPGYRPGNVTGSGAAAATVGAGVAGTAAVATLQAAMEAQAQMITTQVATDISRDVSSAAGTTIGAAVDKTIGQIKNFLMGKAAEGESQATRGIVGRVAEFFKKNDGTMDLSGKVIPVAVIMAIGLGGAFAWRKYLKHRENQKLARMLAKDMEMRREIERMFRSSGMDKYTGQPESYDAVRAIEQRELRSPYMRGY